LVTFFKVVRLRQKLAFSVFVVTLSLTAPAFAASQHLGQRMLREGMSGHDVRVLQQYLTFSGFPTAIDGQFGPATGTNVDGFERQYKLPVNGIVNSRFVRMIRRIVADREGTAAVADSTGGVSFAPPTPAPAGGIGTTGGLSGAGTTPVFGPGDEATLVDGLAIAPADAPPQVQEIIAAANKIATLPYYYGGGHNAQFAASGAPAGYDCSGSTSYALHAVRGMLTSPLDSTGFETWGSAGAGQWVTLWANGGHVYMQVAGLWFDTAAQSSANGNDRWSTTRVDQPQGYIERHPTGL
jgi:peptidoglycan hydrolase-like protein with peptidoglycan-binding domain